VYFKYSKSFMSGRSYEIVFATRECVTRRMLEEDYDNLRVISPMRDGLRGD
jgi:hypothetical protein